MIDEGLLQHVPGCENGDAPYSQELLGGGKVNRSFLVRTRRGRFVVRLNDNSGLDPGLDRDREIALHGLAAEAGIAPHIIHACPDRSCFVTDYVEGRPWTAHYFTRMRDLRALGQRLRTLHALPAPPLPRFDPMAAARRYADAITRAQPEEAPRISSLLGRGEEALERSHSTRREPCVVHNDLHEGNVLTADRIYLIDWEYAQRGDPLLDLACILAYYPRAVPHGPLLIEAAGLGAAGVTPGMLVELTRVFNLLTYLWYRARRLERNVPATDLQVESSALRRLLALAPDA
ncbi:MAG TPA: choline kinase family protein [Steroidobacteraceae bacterium]|nr:choline kinase family protein [Steroidobacteraceae bacterium]